MITPLNEGWVKVQFGDIAEEIKDRVDVPSESGYDRFVGGDHLDSGDLKIKRWGSTNDVHAQKLLFKKGNILFGKRNAYLRKVAFADFDGVCSAHMMVLKPKTEFIIESLFPHFMQSDQFWQKALMISEGSMSPTIKWKILKNQEFTLPPIEEQKQIAKILWAAEDVIVKNETFLAEAEHYKQLMMRDLFSKGIGHSAMQKIGNYNIPMDWDLVKISDICRVRRGASPRPINDQRYFSEDGRGWIRISDVTNVSKYIKKTSQYLSEFGVSKSVPVNPGDLIMSICATIGKPVVVDMNACIHDGFVLFESISEKIDKEYFYNFLLFKEQDFSSQKQSGTQGNLNTTIVGKTIIPLPPLTEQKQIAAILTQIDETITAARETIESTKALKMKLINELLSPGERIEK